MAWFDLFAKKKEEKKEVGDNKPIPDFIWIRDERGNLTASRYADDGTTFIKNEIHKNEIKKRIELARKVKPLRWEVANLTHKTFTAKTASKYIQIFVTGPTTCVLLISTHKVNAPISNPLQNQYVYRNETIKNTNPGKVLEYAYQIHRNEILSELEELS